MSPSLLVTGAAGMLGRDVLRVARERGVDAVGRGRGELDVTDREGVLRALEAEGPGVVVNCAAYTDVDGAEADEAAAMAVNATGAGVLARCAHEAGAAVVHVSTDYVFDGMASEPYDEEAEPRPLSAYGRSKLAGEVAVADANPRHVIARSSWLFGTGGGNFVETMLRLGAERDEVAVVVDQVGCPTWTRHLAEALVELAGGEAWGVHHVAGAGACSWNEFAGEIFRQVGVDCAVREQTTEGMGRPAPRPAYSVLAATRPETPRLAPWTTGLSGYLAERAGDRDAAARGARAT